MLAIGMLLLGCSEPMRVTPPSSHVGSPSQSSSATRKFSPPTSHRVPRRSPATKLSTAPESVFAGKMIGIDPGHNLLNLTRPDIINERIWNGRDKETETCNTTGTATDSGYPEATFNFHVASDLKRLIEARGGRVVMTRQNNDGVGPCVNVRAKIINHAHAAVAIDIHADGGPASGRGFAILEPVPSGTNNQVVSASLKYAEYLRVEFLKTGMPTSTYDGVDGFKARPDLGGLNLTTVPQLLIECGNMRNSTDAAMLVSRTFQQAAAQAIMRAMAKFLSS